MSKTERPQDTNLPIQSAKNDFAETQSSPWEDIYLPKEAMNYLWDIINNSPKRNAKGTLAGNISKSEYIQDKDNWFYEYILKGAAEYMYMKKWDNYYECVVTKNKTFPEFYLKNLWVNYQKQNEFNPLHCHIGLYSFVIFMKIPTHWKEQHALPWLKENKEPMASNFQFSMPDPFFKRTLSLTNIYFTLSPEDEGRMLFFPAELQHQVYPFYECEEERITVSGNIWLPDAPVVEEK